MEKAKLDIQNFLKQNAWGIITAALMLAGNFTMIGFKVESQNRILQDHEFRIRAIELSQQKVLEKLESIEQKTEYIQRKLDGQDEELKEIWKGRK